MRLKRYINESKGSYLDNKKMPKEGQTVYVLVGFDRKVVKGKVIKFNNIDNRGLANTYLDIKLADGRNHHTDISQVYDHKPKQVKTKDEYGDVTIWESTDDDTELAKNHINDNYQTIALNRLKLKDVLKEYIYNLPKKYSTKKEVLTYIRKEYPKPERKDIKVYIEGLDESRLEEFVGFMMNAVDKWM